MLWMAGQCQACPSSSRSLHPNDMNKYPWKSCKHNASRKALNLHRKVCPSKPTYLLPTRNDAFLLLRAVLSNTFKLLGLLFLLGLASIGHVRIKEALFRNWKVARSTELMEESLKLLDLLRSWEMIFTKLCSVCIASQPLQKARGMYNSYKEYNIKVTTLICLFQGPKLEVPTCTYHI